MRKEISRAVRREFAKELLRCLPQFVADRTENIPGVVEHYVWHVAPPLRFYVLLQIHRTRNSFTVELVWTLRDRFPILLPLRSDTSPVVPEGRLRLGMLWDPENDAWWEPKPGSWSNKEELLARVRPAVHDAVAGLVQYGVPHMDAVAKRVSAGQGT